MPPANLRVALVGNPNTGKSTLFNALSGLRQHVGNYPGVTVELKIGRFAYHGIDFTMIDLPGTYSLAPRSPDEMVAVDLLLGRRAEEAPPDLVLAVVDASNVDRHLYLTTQLMELGRPMVVALTMTDTAAASRASPSTTGARRDAGRAGRRRAGQPRRRAERAARRPVSRRQGAHAAGPSRPRSTAELDALQPACPGVPRFLVRRLLFDVGGHVETWLTASLGRRAAGQLTAARDRLAAAGLRRVRRRGPHPLRLDSQGITAVAVTKPATRVTTRTDRIDRVLTHRIWGTLDLLRGDVRCCSSRSSSGPSRSWT